MLQATPVTWRMLLQAEWGRDRRLKIMVGGEALDRDLATALVKRGSQVWNLYGPTETTVWSTVWQVPDEFKTIAIGHPIANTRVYVLDQRLQPVPVGVPGELHIGGVSLARGYLGRPDLTNEKFISDPFSAEAGARMYKTGDLVRWLPDGNIEYLGRLDHQVKVRGFRIELGEIEAVLREHPAVRETVVVARKDASGEKSLVAYLVPHAMQQPTLGDLRAHVRQKLPNYMVPSAFVLLESLPITPNGKVDRRALPSPEERRLQTAHEYEAPRTPLQRDLAAIWAEVLRLDRVGIHDNFFELGGHSLLANALGRGHRKENEKTA